MYSTPVTEINGSLVFRETTNELKQQKNFTYDTLMERIYLFLSRLASIHWWSSGGEGGEKEF